MAYLSRFLAAFGLCLACGAVTARAEETEVPARLSIGPALEYRFETEEGGVYELQGSADGVEWEKVAGPFFGNGRAVEGFLRGEAAARRLPHYRIQELDSASAGPAPARLQRQTLVFNDDGIPRQFIFFTEGRGMLKTDALRARTFTALMERVAADVLEVKITYPDGSGALLKLKFQNSRLGTAEWRQNDAGGEPEFSDAGSFSLHEGRLPEGSPTRGLPVELTGRALLFMEGGLSTRLEFTEPGKVTVHRAGVPPVAYPFVYELEGMGSGVLQLEGENGAAVEYELNLNSPASGTFAKREVPTGGGPQPPAAPASSGTFNMPAEPAPPAKPNCPPPDLEDHSFFLAGSDPVTLSFNKDGSGNALKRANGSVVVTPFKYDYSRSGPDSASLTLTFQGVTNDLIEDYTLNFNEDCGGSYERSEFEGGQFTSRDGGVFGQSAAVPSSRLKLRLGLAW